MSRWCSRKRRTVVPLIVSDAYHRGGWKKRKAPRWADLFK